MSQDATEQQLVDALRAAAPINTHVEGGLADLRGRIGGATTMALPVAAVRNRRSRWHIAAAVAAVVVLVGAVVLASQRDEPTDVATSPGRDLTGWYIPEGLDGDWQLETVSTDFRDAEDTGADCPCETWLWVDHDVAQSVYVHRSELVTGESVAVPYGDDDLPALEAVELGGGVEATFVVSGFGPYLVFDQGQHRWIVEGLQLPKDDTIEIGRRIVEAQGDPAPVSDGFDLIENYTTDGGIDSYQDVHVILKNQVTGDRMAYVLAPAGRGPNYGFTQSMPWAVEPGGIVGQGIAAVGWPVPSREPEETEVAAVFRMPDADISTDSDAAFGAEPGATTSDDVLELFAALRPASAAEWATYVRTATNTGEVDEVTAATIDDLSGPSTVATTTEPN